MSSSVNFIIHINIIQFTEFTFRDIPLHESTEEEAENDNESDASERIFIDEHKLMALKKKLRVEGHLEKKDFDLYVELLSESIANRMNDIMKCICKKYPRAYPSDAHIKLANNKIGKISLSVACPAKECKARRKTFSLGFSQDNSANLANFKRHYIKLHGSSSSSTQSSQNRTSSGPIKKRKRKQSDEDYSFSMSYIKQEPEADNSEVNQIWLGSGRHQTDEFESGTWNFNDHANSVGQFTNGESDEMSRIDLALSKMLISASMPFEIVDNRYFKDFVHELNSNYNLPRSRDLKEQLLSRLSK